MTQTEIRASRRGMQVMTPDGAVARITTNPYPRPGTADMQVGASYRDHVFVLSHHNSYGWSVTGDPSDRFVYALSDLEGGPLSEAKT